MHITFASVVGLNETHKYDSCGGGKVTKIMAIAKKRGVEFGLIVMCVRCVMCVVVVCVMCGEFSVIVL